MYWDDGAHAADGPGECRLRCAAPAGGPRKPALGRPRAAGRSHYEGLPFNGCTRGGRGAAKGPGTGCRKRPLPRPEVADPGTRNRRSGAPGGEPARQGDHASPACRAPRQPPAASQAPCFRRSTPLAAGRKWQMACPAPQKNRGGGALASPAVRNCTGAARAKNTARLLLQRVLRRAGEGERTPESNEAAAITGCSRKLDASPRLCHIQQAAAYRFRSARCAPSRNAGVSTCPHSSAPPAACNMPKARRRRRNASICEEERQYVPPRGQTWTTLAALAQSHINTFREYETASSASARSRLSPSASARCCVRTEGGNVLWDCIATLDAATVTLIEGLGGIDAIAISHPHFYTTMVEWARAFMAPIHLHAADRNGSCGRIRRFAFWDGETLKLWDGVTLVRCGGHFEGGTVLHWAQAARRPRRRLRRRHSHRSPPTASGCPSCAAIRISFRCRRARCEHIGQALAPFRLRRHLRPLFRPRDREGRQAGAGEIRRALCRGDRGQAGVLVESNHSGVGPA